ncbi:MAG: hypothetical protein WCE76_09670 [Mycobacterium sp.]
MTAGPSPSTQLGVGGMQRDLGSPAVDGVDSGQAVFGPGAEEESKVTKTTHPAPA